MACLPFTCQVCVDVCNLCTTTNLLIFSLIVVATCLPKCHFSKRYIYSVWAVVRYSPNTVLGENELPLKVHTIMFALKSMMNNSMIMNTRKLRGLKLPERWSFARIGNGCKCKKVFSSCKYLPITSRKSPQHKVCFKTAANHANISDTHKNFLKQSLQFV